MNDDRVRDGRKTGARRRERERERDWKRNIYTCVCVFVCLCVHGNAFRVENYRVNGPAAKVIYPPILTRRDYWISIALPQPTLSRPLHARKYTYIYILYVCVLTLAGWRKSHCYFADIFIVEISARATAACRFEVRATCKTRKREEEKIQKTIITYSENPRNGIPCNAAVDSRSAPRRSRHVFASRLCENPLVRTSHSRRHYRYFRYRGDASTRRDTRTWQWQRETTNNGPELVCLRP